MTSMFLKNVDKDELLRYDCLLKKYSLFMFVRTVELCSKTMANPKDTVEPMWDLARIAEATHKLTSLLDGVLAYVEDVLAGKVPPDNAVGRALTDMINSVPKMTPEEFEKMFNSNIKVGLLNVSVRIFPPAKSLVSYYMFTLFLCFRIFLWL